MVAILMVLAVVQLVVHRSDARKAAANHRQANQWITAMEQDFERRLETQGRLYALSDADLWTIAKSTTPQHLTAENGLLAVSGIEVLEPVTRGANVSFDFRTKAVYLVTARAFPGSAEDDRCFRATVQHVGTPAAAVTISELAPCSLRALLPSPPSPPPTAPS